MNNMPHLRAIVRLCTLLVTCQLTSVQAAAPTPIEIQPNDTLGSIVLLAYPEYGNRQAAMQAILARNPDAFIENDINRLIVGKVLQFPDASELPATTPRVPTVQTPDPVEVIASANQETLQQLEKVSQEKDRLTSALTALSVEKTALSAEKNALKQQLSTLKSDQSASTTQLQQALETLQNTNATLKTDNAALLNKLQNTSNDSNATDATQAPDNSALLEQLQNTNTTLETDNTTLQTQLKTAQEQLTAHTKTVELLKADLDKLGQKNAALTSKLETLTKQNADLQSALETSTQQSTDLQNDINQIKTAAANDVKLLKEKQALQNKKPLWPWLLALLLLPIAWLLGRRSRSTVAATQANIANPAGEAATQNLTAATNGPMIPTALPGELDNIATLNMPTTPDDPDTAIKLDMARAYLDLRDSDAANDMLKEVIREGGTRQQQEAREILSFIN